MRFLKVSLVVVLCLAALLAVGITMTIGWRPFLGPRARPLTGRVFERTRSAGRVDGHTLDQLTVTPKLGKPFGAFFDADTHLLARITEDRQFFHTRTLYAAYRRRRTA